MLRLCMCMCDVAGTVSAKDDERVCESKLHRVCTLFNVAALFVSVSGFCEWD